MRWFQLAASACLSFYFLTTLCTSTSAEEPPPDARQTAIEELQSNLSSAKKQLAEQQRLLQELQILSEGTRLSATEATATSKERGDIAWMLTATAFVMLMVPGLALFYGGMVRRKNILATMMHSMAAIVVVGVYWILIGYALAFGPSLIKVNILGVKDAGLIGWSWKLVLIQGVPFDAKLPGYDIPIYLHVIFQGMFAIITPALISGAIAERIRFWPFCLFILLWITFVYCPLAHMVWAFDWFDPQVVISKRGTTPIGLLAKMGALDFAGGTVVHIAAGVAGLACAFVLGKRAGYPKMIAHPNSIALTLLGAGLLWFGWFGFNGGSAVAGTAQAVSAFAATQVAAAAGGLGWLVVEWLHRGKPTALGLASGVVAGLVAVTPASGYIYIWAGLFIGLPAAALCYLAVSLKQRLGYDDSLDAFGVHGIGGFVGAVLTGVFCSTAITPSGADGLIAYIAHRARFEELTANNLQVITQARSEANEAIQAAQQAEAQLKDNPLGGSPEQLEDLERKKDSANDRIAYATSLEKELATLQELIAKQDDIRQGGQNRVTAWSQLGIQTKAALVAALYAFLISLLLAVLTQRITRHTFRTDEKGEADGLDRTEHGEVGFDISGATESVAVAIHEPRRAVVPRGNGRFELQVIGSEAGELMKVWSSLCQPSDEPADPDFLAVYPYVTTIRGTIFRFRGGQVDQVVKHLSNLFTRQLGKAIQVQQLSS